MPPGCSLTIHGSHFVLFRCLPSAPYLRIHMKRSIRVRRPRKESRPVEWRTVYFDDFAELSSNNGKSKVTKKVSKNGNILNTVKKNLSRFK